MLHNRGIAKCCKHNGRLLYKILKIPWRFFFPLILELNQRFWLMQVAVVLIVLLPVGKLCFVLVIHGVNLAGKENRTA